MNIFRDYKLSVWELGMLKLAMFLIGIVIGAYWYSIWMPYLPIMLVVGIILAIYLLYAWIAGKL